MKQLILVLLLIPISLMAQEPKPGNLSPVLAKGGYANLAKEWKYKAGDKPEWANPDFDDTSWQTFIDDNLYNEEIQEKAKKTGIIWYRKKISIDSTTTQKLVIAIYQSGASEIYLDGELIHSLGKVSGNLDSLVRINQAPVQLTFPMKINKEQVLAIRFADPKSRLPLFQEQNNFLQVFVRTVEFANEYEFAASDTLFNDIGFLHLGYLFGWRFHPGDDLDWSKPDYDESEWYYYKPSILTEPIPDSLWNGYGWFRMRFTADSSACAKTTHLYFYTLGSAEIYLDGKLVQKFGEFSIDPDNEKHVRPSNEYYSSVVVQPGGSHVLAVRYAFHKGVQYKKFVKLDAGRFGFSIALTTDYWKNKTSARKYDALREFYILATMLFLVVLLHLLLFLLFPADRSNLYITILVFLLFLHVVVGWMGLFFELDILHRWYFHHIPYIFLIMAALSMIPFTISYMFNQKPRLIHKILIWLSPVLTLANFILSGPDINIPIVIVLIIGTLFLSYLVLIKAWRNKQKGVWIIAGAFLSLALSGVTFLLYSTFSQNYSIDSFSSFLYYLIYGSIPLGLTGFMASRFRDLYSNLEQKVHDRTLELEQSLEELRSTQSQLIQSEKMASLGQLTAGIAHEIQNPLNFVNNFSEVSKELVGEMNDELAVGNWQLAKDISKDIEQNLEKINHHGKRADAIVKGMLQHSRANTGHKEPIDINVLADEYLRLSYHGMRAKDKSFNAEYKTEFDPNLPKINVVPQDIGRVLLNLINNAFYAVQAPPPPEKSGQAPVGGIKERGADYKPTVIVRTSSYNPPSGGRGASVSVVDNGPGIPASIKDKIFQPFFTTKPTGQGTGLGLSLAYDMVKAHGGELKVETKEGEGSEFIIYLPNKLNEL